MIISSDSLRLNLHIFLWLSTSTEFRTHSMSVILEMEPSEFFTHQRDGGDGRRIVLNMDMFSKN